MAIGARSCLVKAFEARFLRRSSRSSLPTRQPSRRASAKRARRLRYELSGRAAGLVLQLDVTLTKPGAGVRSSWLKTCRSDVRGRCSRVATSSTVSPGSRSRQHAIVGADPKPRFCTDFWSLSTKASSCSGRSALRHAAAFGAGSSTRLLLATLTAASWNVALPGFSAMPAGMSSW